MNDEQLLLYKARQLDQEALATIHDLYYDAIYRYISFRVQNEEMVADLTNEVFMRLLNALHDKHAPQNTIRGWLYGVAARVVKEFYRKQARAKESPLEEYIPDQGRALFEHVEQQLLREKLLSVMQDLTEDQQNVLALRFGFEMSIREVAQTMDKSEGSIKMLQARAIAALSRRLAVWGASA